MNEEPKIKITDPIDEINHKFDLYIKFVIGVLVIAVITLLLMVGGFLLDAWHFNSAVYREYSQKTDLIEQLQKTNQLLLEQNQQHQQTIIEQQQQIKRMLGEQS